MHCAKPLDAAAMRAGAALLTGVHDFTQFSNNAPERLKRNPVKDLWRLDVVEVPGGLRLEVEGSGFLYKQVCGLPAPWEAGRHWWGGRGASAAAAVSTCLL
jgi:tRNA pseudouridine(38-40) synthase